MPETIRTHLDLFSGIPSAASRSRAGGSGSKPSASLKLTHTPVPSSKSIGQTFQIMEIYETSEEYTQTWLPVDSLANLSVSPGSAEARQMTVGSGRKCSVLLMRDDLLSSWLKTCLESSAWNSTVCFLTWKVSATPQGRLLFRLVPSMPDTEETGCGFWGTPQAQDAKHATVSPSEMKRDPRNLRIQVHNQSLWPTPTACLSGQGDPQDPKRGIKLQTVVSMFPTPSSRDWKSSNASPETMEANSRPLNEVVTNGKGGSLNPTWVEWLQGFPPNWTELPDGPTKIRKSQGSQSASKTASKD